jgi:hypothetical protein
MPSTVIRGAQIKDADIATADIANNAVTYGKIQVTSANSRLLGSPSTGTTVGEITVGSGLSLSGSTLTATGGAGSGFTRQIQTQVATLVTVGGIAANTDLYVVMNNPTTGTITLPSLANTTGNQIVTVKRINASVSIVPTAGDAIESVVNLNVTLSRQFQSVTLIPNNNTTPASWFII